MDTKEFITSPKRLYNKAYYWKNPEYHRKRVSNYYYKHKEERSRKNKEWRDSEKGKDWKERNKDKTREYQREWMKDWRKKNPDKVYERNHSEKNKEQQKRYREKHRGEISKRKIRYQKKRRETDTNFRLSLLLRGRILSAIKKQCGSKAYKSIELLGCSIQEIKEHIEKQFTPEMSWENHGEVWEIDHIVGVSKFDLTKPEEQKKAFHYTNFQPLFWRENRVKQ